MVPNVAKTGTSFKGAALYYLHDKREAWEAERMTADRVAWTATRNLATQNPDTAWRIMAATAMDADRLKAEAGIKNTGRKSDKSVYAYSLSWHEQDGKLLSRAEMMRAADETIRVLGAEKHQAIIICHRDEPHPHVHILLNRVDPETGRMLAIGRDHLKLSQWSEAYERERGKIWCHERVANNAQRAQGAFVRAAAAPTPRSMVKDFETARVANDNAARQARETAKIRAAKLASDTAAMRKRHGIEWQVLSKTVADRRGAIYDQAKRQGEKIRTEIAANHKPAWRELYRQQWQERRAFDRREGRLLGKIENALSAITHRKDLDPADSRGFLTAAFAFLGSKEARARSFEQSLARQKQDLRRDERRAVDRAMAAVRTARTALLGKATAVFSSERTALADRQASEKVENKQLWRAEHESRSRGFDTIRRDAKARQTAKADPANRRDEAPKVRRDFQDAAEGNVRRATRPRRRLKRSRKG